MELLFESFVPMLIVGSVMLFFLIAFWVVARQTWALYASAVPILIIAGGFIIDEMVETNREAVWKTINAIQDALVAGDVEEIEKYLTSDAKTTFNRVKWAFDNFDIRRVGVYDMEMEFNDFTSPPTATISFQGVVKYSAKKAENNFGETYVARFNVELEKDGDVWLVTHHVETEGLNPFK
ncbi:MAG: hypothetical protein IKX40_07990 [Thermoguttaceae bacterium]|nr:hypothetical protein [Thermoguttaceae bacterium]